jgi:glycosyltransferase involved in cell wall biosynthesis
LIDEYRSMNDRLHYRLAPIPHVPHLAPTDGERSAKLHFGYVGEARENKGFQLLPHVIRRTVPYAAAAHFHIHSFCHDPQSPFYRQAIAGLRGSHVTLYPEKLDDPEYDSFLEQLDVVVLPYTLHHYHSQTSGVFAEAMALGKTLVVPRGSWMSRQVDEYGGGASFNPGDAEDLAQKILALIQNGRVDGERAAERAGRWRQFHSPANLLQLILAPAGCDGAEPNLVKPAASYAL